jgi:DNA (cytosine-5)-methyltransferase 1
MNTELESGSVCAGIGGFDLGFENAGIKTAWQIEFDDDAHSVLEKRFPNANRSVRDLTDPKRKDLKRVSIITGGTPCQGFSLAGLRGSLQDDRSNLCLQFVKLLDEHEPTFFVWENVPGVLSLDDNAFGIFLAGLVGASSALVPPKSIKRWRVVDRYPDCTDDCERDDEGKRLCGHASVKVDVFSWPNAGVVVGPKRTVAWRVLDSQFFGVAQRRERVFVVGDTLGGLSPEILFECRSMSGNSKASREPGKNIANALTGSLGSGGADDNKAQAGHVVAVGDNGKPADQRGYRMTAFGEYADDNKASTIKQRDHKDATDLVVSALTTKSHADRASEEAKLVVIPIQEIGKRQSGTPMNGTGHGKPGDPMYTLQASAVHGVAVLQRETQKAVAGRQREGKPGGGKGPLCSEEQSLTLGTSNDQVIFDPIGPTAVCVTGEKAHTLTSEGFDASEDGTGRGTPITPAFKPVGINGGEVSFALRANGSRSGDKGDGGINTSFAINPFGVRRLTPVECEKLQGFPPDWTAEGLVNGKVVKQSDSARYKQCGNAVTTKVAEWIGHRIKKAYAKYAKDR